MTWPPFWHMTVAVNEVSEEKREVSEKKREGASGTLNDQ